MNKKLWLTALVSPVAILPVLTTVACQSTSNTSQNQVGNIGNSELSRFIFLTFKSEIITMVVRDQINDAEQLKKRIIDKNQNSPTIRELNVNVTTENENFVVEYKLKVIAGSMIDFGGVKDPSLIKETESLSGTFKIPIPKGN